MKKILLLLLVAAMLLSLSPSVIFAEDTQEAATEVKLYDAHITGNLVVGGTLTANFKPIDSDVVEQCGLSMDATKATIKWYARNRYADKASRLIDLNNDGKNTYTIPDNFLYTSDTTDTTILNDSNAFGIFFTVIPMGLDGQPKGNKIFSSMAYNVAAVDASKTTPVAYNAHILPLNGDGIIDVGRTVAARFSMRYQANALVNEGTSMYTWYTSDERLASSQIADKAKCVKEASSSAEYTITSADAGKWLYVKIVPYSADGNDGTAVYAKNHLGNAFLRYGVADADECNNFYGKYSSEGTGIYKYPYVKLLADGCSTNGTTDGSTYLVTGSTNVNTVRTIEIDVGEMVPFDAFYFNFVSANDANNINSLTIGYSNDGVTYTNVLADSSGQVRNRGEHIFPCDTVAYAQYFKFSFKNNAAAAITVHDFYPFLKNTATINYSNSSFAQLNGNDIEVQAWGTPLNELSKASNGLEVTSKLDGENSTVVADEILENCISFVTKSDGEYVAIENPENIKVTENLENTYLMVNDTKDNIAYYKISYNHLAEFDGEEIIGSEGLTQVDTNGTYPVDAAPINNHDANGYIKGQYLFKTQLQLNPGYRVILSARQGGISDTGASIRGILMFNAFQNASGNSQSANSGISGLTTQYPASSIAVPQKMISGNTGYSFKKGKWIDVEVLFDFDSAVKGQIADGATRTINISVWVDGKKLVDNYACPWKDPIIDCADGYTANTNFFSPYFEVYSANKSTTNPPVRSVSKNSSFRQVWSADTHVVENNYALNIVEKDTPDAPVTTLVAGNYTVSNNMNIFKDNDYINYIAKYYVNGDSAELISVVHVSNADDFIEVTDNELAQNEVVLKALSVSNLLTPNYIAKIVRK